MKITRAACRHNSKSHIPRAVKFVDIITANHKVFNEEGNHQRHANVVQDFGHSMGSKLPIQNKNSTRNDEKPTEISRS